MKSGKGSRTWHDGMGTLRVDSIRSKADDVMGNRHQADSVDIEIEKLNASKVFSEEHSSFVRYALRQCLQINLNLTISRTTPTVAVVDVR